MGAAGNMQEGREEGRKRLHGAVDGQGVGGDCSALQCQGFRLFSDMGSAPAYPSTAKGALTDCPSALMDFLGALMNSWNHSTTRPTPCMPHTQPSRVAALLGLSPFVQVLCCHAMSPPSRETYFDEGAPRGPVIHIHS